MDLADIEQVSREWVDSFGASTTGTSFTCIQDYTPIKTIKTVQQELSTLLIMQCVIVMYVGYDVVY